MEKIIILAVLALGGQSSFGADLASVESLTCGSPSGQLYASYDQGTRTLDIVKNGQEKKYVITKANGDIGSELILNGRSATSGSVQANLSSDGTMMIYQIATGEVDYLVCN